MSPPAEDGNDDVVCDLGSGVCRLTHGSVDKCPIMQAVLAAPREEHPEVVDIRAAGLVALRRRVVDLRPSALITVKGLGR
ncbi:MAG: hypothetical protein LBV34_07170 [Nocardiopsaceae bacterium]|jgi:hypothetical protein|nr:hypothetical protein [Nocardiopsaceae bacterium]